MICRLVGLISLNLKSIERVLLNINSFIEGPRDASTGLLSCSKIMCR